MKRYILYILCVVALLTAFIVPCYAYEANPYTGLMGYALNRPTFSYIIDGEGTDMSRYLYGDTLPYTVPDALDWSGAFVYDYYDNEFANAPEYESFLRCGFPQLGQDASVEYSITIPWFVYRDYGLYGDDRCYMFENCRGSFTMEIYGLDGTYKGKRELTFDAGDGRSGRVLLGDELNLHLGASEKAFVWVSIDPSSISENTLVYVPLYSGDELIADAATRPPDLDDLQVNTTFADVPVGEFLWNSIDGFLSFELVEGISLYTVLLALVALPLLLWFLKLVAGG